MWKEVGDAFGATTENPYFESFALWLLLARIFELRPMTEAHWASSWIGR
jgi:replication-associated recombination protein RarA